MSDLTAVKRAFLNSVTVSFIGKHEVTRKLNVILFTYPIWCLHFRLKYAFRELQYRLLHLTSMFLSYSGGAQQRNNIIYNSTK
jgi:hypothetical protein